MKTNYKIKKAHSGTTEKEIAKAKKLFRIGIISGKFYNVENVGIEFSDINNVIKANYIDLDNWKEIGTEII
ncbi:MAG: hypothetical protein WC389_19000 [Lutibacter sp.]|jgi:hypothetical protein